MCTRGAYAQQRIGVGQCVVSGARDTGRETTTEHKTTINNTNTPNNNKIGVRDCWFKVWRMVVVVQQQGTVVNSSWTFSSPNSVTTNICKVIALVWCERRWIGIGGWLNLKSRWDLAIESLSWRPETEILVRGRWRWRRGGRFSLERRMEDLGYILLQLLIIVTLVAGTLATIFCSSSKPEVCFLWRLLSPSKWEFGK